MSDHKPSTMRQEATERLQAEEAEVRRIQVEMGEAAKTWGAKQTAADIAFAEFLRLQQELGIRLFARKMARLILIGTPDAPAADAMGAGHQA